MIRRVVAAAALALCGCEREDCPQPTPQALTNQGVGEPCGASANCTSGLTCRQVYEVPNYTSPVFTANACTSGCDAGCPSAAACGAFDICWRTCVDDSDCRAGISAGTCDAGVCNRSQCTEDAQCPAGFACEIPAVVCCPRGAKCIFAGNVAGYCRRS